MSNKQKADQMNKETLKQKMIIASDYAIEFLSKKHLTTKEAINSAIEQKNEFILKQYTELLICASKVISA
jgi:predicted nuclease of restriction endonuclease-like (RecB) superfamily